MTTKQRRIDPYGQRAEINKFKSQLAADAPLGAILDSKEIEKSIVTYEEKNDKAVKLQNRYKRLDWWALLLATLGTLFAAATLLPISKWVPKDAARIVSGLQAAANIILSEEPIRWQLGLNTMASSLLAYASAYT